MDSFYSAFANINKARGRDTTSDTVEGVVSDFLPELTLDMKDEDLIDLTQKWEKKWDSSTIKSNWLKQADENENYWKGKHFNKNLTETSRPLIDNIIFQAVETYLPAASRQDPQPLVELRATEEKSDTNQKYADVIRDRLADWADDIKLRLKLKKAGRHWLINLVGVGKMGWDEINDRPALKILRPKKIIFDPDGVTDEDGYSGKYIGEFRKMEASLLTEQLEGNKDAVEEIKTLAKGDMGTDIQFIEWWTNEYMCWTVGKKVLLKKKNPHWNYDKETKKNEPKSESNASDETKTAEPIKSPYYASESDADKTTKASLPMLPEVALKSSTPTANPKKAHNHFASIKMPYIFLVIFNLGKSPVDETSLITQTLPQQDITNKRLKQIDKNADGMNSGMVVSEERSGLTKEEAKGVTAALAKGGTVVIPAGAPGDAVARFNASPLPTDVYNNLQDQRNRLYDLFGIRGITPAGIKNEDTVRGKIITKGLDTDRIGGGITEYFEQFADEAYNWCVQLYYIYDEMFVNNPQAVLPKLKVSVKEGSLLPKDATTIANQAIELAGAGKLSLIDLFKALEKSDPEELAVNVWLEANAPELLYKDDPRVAQVVQQKQQQMQQMAQAEAAAKQKPPQAPKGPSESISYKDIPPAAKEQMLAQAGIHAPAEDIAAHDIAQTAPDLSSVPIPSG